MRKILDTNFKKIIIEGKEVYEAKFTAPTIDRDNELLLTSGIDISHYLKNPVIFYDHAWATWDSPHEETLPIGKAVNVKIGKKEGSAQFVFSDLPFAQKVKVLVDEGILNMTSIGFIPKEYLQSEQEMKKILDADGIKLDALPRIMFTKSEMLEFSIVGIPSNREAAILNSYSGHKAKEIKSILHSISGNSESADNSRTGAQASAEEGEKKLTYLKKRVICYRKEF